MNLIDAYGLNDQSVQEPIVKSAKLTNQSNMTSCLLFLKEKMAKIYRDAHISCCFNPGDEGEPAELVMNILDCRQRGGFQFVCELAICEEIQSISVRGELLRNSVPVKVNGRERIMMGLRLACELSNEVSPLKLIVHPHSGCLSLLYSSYIDTQFQKLSAPKNIPQFTTKMTYIIQLLFQHRSILQLFVKDVEALSLSQYLNRSNDYKQASIRLSKVELSLSQICLPTFDPCSGEICPYRKMNKMREYALIFHGDVQQIINRFRRFNVLEQKNKPAMSQLASAHYYCRYTLKKTVAKTDLQLHHQILSRVVIKDETKVAWKPFTQGGYAIIQQAQVSLKVANRIEKELEQVQDEYFETLITRKKDLPINRSSLERARTIREKLIIKKLQKQSHPNIVSFLQTQISEKQNFLYSVFQENTSLELLLRKIPDMSFIQKVVLLQQSARGLLFLHNKKILHLDFKSSNLFIGKHHLLKVGDFGQSFAYDGDPAKHQFGYTFPYAPPQLYDQSKPTKKRVLDESIDIYSLGVTIFKSLFGEIPWKAELARSELQKRFRRGEKLSFLLIPETYRESGFERVITVLLYLCLRCLDPEPIHRPAVIWATTVLMECRVYLQLAGYR